MFSELFRCDKCKDLDSPQTTNSRAGKLQKKLFLKKIYRDWYQDIKQVFSNYAGEPILELGSGPGFLKEFIPAAITSDIQKCQNLDLIFDGRFLPFKNNSLRGIAMIDVFHHIPEPRKFLKEAIRCLKPAGLIFMIEPWVSPWSLWVNTKIKHEPFLFEQKEWEFTSTGPLSGANQALPWIVFKRDYRIFRKEFPQLTVTGLRPSMPLRYIFSGGFAYRSIMPSWSYGFWRNFEKILGPCMENLAMFAQILITKS